MSQRDQALDRIAAALERLAPPTLAPTDWNAHPAYLWEGGSALGLDKLDALALEQLRGIETASQAISDNLARLARGAAAHDMLLWGARGMGKSALVRAAVRSLQDEGCDLAIVQVSPDGLAHIPALISTLAKQKRTFVLFLDDLGFGDADLQANLALRSLLDGGALGRPHNIKVAVTSNRRAIVEREGETAATLHERDERDNALALADRFGLTLAFHPCDQDTYLEIVRSYTSPLGLHVDDTEANRWAIARGNRSGRSAYQFACELAGRAGLALTR